MQVAPPGQTKDRDHALCEGVRSAEPLKQSRAVVVIHVDHGHVWAPRGQDRLGLRQAARGPNGEDAVVKRQLDEVHDQLSLVEHQGAACLLWPSFHVTDRPSSVWDTTTDR